MERARRALVAIPAAPLAAAGLVASQVLRAAHRRDLPSFPNQDPSALLGDPSSPLLRMVAIGDSSLTAPGVARLENVWIRRVASHFAADHRVELVSLAVGGSKARDVIEGQLAGAIRLDPDIAVVAVGANDALRGTLPGRYRRELTEILARLSETRAGIVVFGMGDLSSIPRLPPSLRPWLASRSRRFNEVARSVVVRFPRAVKVNTRGPISDRFFDDETLWAGDQFHASDAGHGLFAEGSLEAFQAALSLRRTS